MPVTGRYTRYIFQGYTGYLVHHGGEDADRGQAAWGHAASVEPWSDPGVHAHEISEEIYFLLQGEIHLLVNDLLLTLRPREILLVRPLVPHAIVGGAGRIEHIGVRAPGVQDKYSLGEFPPLPPVTGEAQRELRAEWGFRASLASPEFHNWWLIGAGSARFASSHLALAYLNFLNVEAANAGLGTRHRLHAHQRSWETYVVLKGTKTLQVEDELVSLGAGEALEIPPGVFHTLHSRQAPFEGITFRAPLVLDDKVER